MSIESSEGGYRRKALGLVSVEVYGGLRQSDSLAEEGKIQWIEEMA